MRIIALYTKIISRIECRDTNGEIEQLKGTDKPIEKWTFFSNNAHVLVCLTHNPQPTTREIAIQVGITERAVQRILKKMIDAGVLQVRKTGRRNHYELDLQQRLRHPLEAHKTIGEFLKLIGD